MPLYEYECEACGQRFELIRKFSDPPLDVCTLCGKGPVTRLLSSPAIQFKGSGFYITDYVKKGEGGKGEGGKGEAGKSVDSKTSAISETKSDSAASDSAAKSDTKSGVSSASGSSTAAAPAKSSGTAKD
jgi:putative FmdB family regulatory protein